MYWFNLNLEKKENSKEETKILEDHDVMNTLQTLAKTYKLCSECFECQNYPRVHSKDDFKMCSIETVLTDETVELADRIKDD